MPFDYSDLPDKTRAGQPQPKSSGFDYSDLPDKTRAGDLSAAPADHEPSFLERMGGMRGLIANIGVRGLAGYLASEGGPWGAAITGAAEPIAEAVEQGTFYPKVNPARVATEAALGAIPLHKVGSTIAQAATRMGLLGATGAGARQLAEGQPLDPVAIATQGGLNALLGGGAKALATRAPKAGYKAVRPAEVLTERPMPPAEPTGMPAAAPTPDISGVPYRGQEPAPYRPSARRVIAEEAKAAREAAKAAATQERATGTMDLMSDYGAMSPEELAAVQAEHKLYGMAKTGRSINELAEAAEAGGPRISEPVTTTPPTAGAPPAPQPTPLGLPAASPEATLRSKLGPFGEFEQMPSPARPAELQLRPGIPSESEIQAGTPPKTALQEAQDAANRAGREYRVMQEAAARGEQVDLDTARKAAVDAWAKVREAQAPPATAEVRTPSVAPEAPGPSTPSAAIPEKVMSRDQQNILEAAQMMDPQTRQNFLQRLMKEETGAINPALLKLFAPVTGATVGAPVGAYFNPDDPQIGALKGALGGAALGWGTAQGLTPGAAGKSAISEGLHELINIRNAGLLSGLAQVKKPLSDIGAYIGLMAETPGKRLDLLREGLRFPTHFQNYLSALKDPSIEREVLGDMSAAAERGASGPMGWVGRPYAAANYTVQQAMERAGIPRQVAKDALLVGDPKTGPGDWWIKGQKYPLIRALRPFSRVATNLAERGLERIPGPSLFMGDPATRLQRTLAGAGAMGAGALVGAKDTADAEAGDPTSKAVKGLRRALASSYGGPFTIGEVLGGSSPSEVYYMVPGLSQTIPPPAADDTAMSYTRKIGNRFLEQMLPSFLSPDTGSTR